MKITPRGKYILVQKDAPVSRESEHGIVTPTTVEREQKAFGTVLSVGPEIKDVKKGDRVVYGAFAGEQMEYEEKNKKIECRLLHDDDVLAFIK